MLRDWPQGVACRLHALRAGGGRPDELDAAMASGELIVLKRLPDLMETFFAVTITKKFPNPNLERIVKRLSVAFSARGG